MAASREIFFITMELFTNNVYKSKLDQPKEAWAKMPGQSIRYEMRKFRSERCSDASNAMQSEALPRSCRSIR